jgi:hypothetical protein
VLEVTDPEEPSPLARLAVEAIKFIEARAR